MSHSEDGFEGIIRDLWQHGSRRTLRFVKLGPRSGKDVVPGVNLFQPDIAIGAKQFNDAITRPLDALKSHGRRSALRWKATCACRRFPIEPSEGKSLTVGVAPFFALTSARARRLASFCTLCAADATSLRSFSPERCCPCPRKTGRGPHGTASAQRVQKWIVLSNRGSVSRISHGRKQHEL